ncbi:UNVERIFIED_CONTAM: Retrovirus-related Pol polyprotein from transposon RE1 [Sesamum latifolium]|uniref:Retrovirus-related Pol polyprotein from transposon RE1 n=1 Tax=Sesamum latifolium TaxID=2727402 RepID=A0AAW2VHK1_9LAMI
MDLNRHPASGMRNSLQNRRLVVLHSPSTIILSSLWVPIFTFLAFLVYVDDVLLTGSLDILIAPVKAYLDRLFTIKDLGYAKYFLGIEIVRSDRGMLLTQHKYISDIVCDAGLQNSKATTKPLLVGIRLTSDGGVALPNPETYRRLVGRLVYLNFTRPNISYATQQLSQFLQHPCKQHLDAALHLVKYLKGCPSNGLFYSTRSSLNLSAHCDADWASCHDSRRSLMGFCIFLGSSLISWKTKKQNTVSRSTAEAEYQSMGATSCELTWMKYLLQNLHIPVHTPVPFYCDNKVALTLLKIQLSTKGLNIWRLIVT